MGINQLMAVLNEHFYDDEIKQVVELYATGLRPIRVSADMYKVSVIAGKHVVISRGSIRQQLLKRYL